MQSLQVFWRPYFFQRCSEHTIRKSILQNSGSVKMDAGLAAMSSKGQMRRDLYQSDVGNIDVSQEVPTNPAQSRQAYPRWNNRMVPPQQQYPAGYWSEEPERRAYSLNQKSISSFFRHRGPKTGHGKGKGEFGGRDEDEEVMVDDSMSMMTYNDIRTTANKGGDRYGYGGDTAPIIPTLVTKDHGNMNNVEYRKHMTAQKKSAMNAMARQQKDAADGRAMSLQGYNSGNPMAQPNRMYPQYPMQQPMQGPYGNDRSNSMMHPPGQFQRNAFYGQNTHGPGVPIGPGIPNGPGGPRAMSLMSGNARPPIMRPAPTEFQAGPRQQGYGPPRRMSSSNVPMNPNTMPAQSAPREDNRAQLNVLKLSAPQQNDWREKERLLAEREKELKEKERLIEEQEAKIREELREKQDKLTEQNATNRSVLTTTKNDIDLDPSPTLENGLQSMSIGDSNVHRKNDMHNRVSTGTFVSAFSSDSPEKRRIANRSGLYQLEEKNRSMFVTAQEFPQAGGPNPTHSTDSMDQSNSTLIKDTVTESTSEASQDKTAKRSSLIKAKDFLRKLSSSSVNKEYDSQLALNRSSSRMSVSSIPNSESSHYTMLRNREQENAKKTNGEDKLAKSSNAQDDPDAFIFDNTVGKPYVPSFAKENEIREVNKFKTITISGEQLNILSENKELMNELTLVSMELAESTKRETVLEEQLRTLNQLSQEESSLSLADFEIELRKKSSKIVELIQQLNNERLKRFIAEEQILLAENGVKPSSIELLHKISALESELEAKDAEISQLKNQISQ